MQTIHTRTYTNVALTVLILLLLVLAARPYIGLPAAQAASSFSMSGETPKNDHKSALLEDPYAGVAAALREVAASNKEIASAIRDTAQSQAAVAKAIQSLGASASAVTPAR